MKKVAVPDIQDGMILARPVIGSDGKILLADGEELKSSIAPRLRNWGVFIVFIREEGEEQHPSYSEDKQNRLIKLETSFGEVLDNPRMNTLYNAIRQYIQNKD